MEIKKKEIIKKAALLAFLIIATVAVAIIMIKYEIEGEANLPFKLTKIMVISTADGISDGTQELSIAQNNDIYLYIEKNQEYKEQSFIEKVSIENIKILSKPQKGNVVFFRPNNAEGLAYKYEEQFIIKEKIEYTGEDVTDLKTLSISNQGGTISFRASTKDVGKYTTEGETGLINDGTLLQKAQVSIADIKYSFGFDIVLEIDDGKKYKAYANVNIPVESLENERISSVEKLDLTEIVFKRVKF